MLEEDRTTGQRNLRFRPGPIFTNILLADEINRTPPKTQAALLEAMQEHQVTVSGSTYALEEPFFVLATQNPIEQEGTYPLPKIQQDRFMFSLVIDYLPRDQELEVVNATTGAERGRHREGAGRPGAIAVPAMVRETPVAEPIIRYAVSLASAQPARRKAGTPDFIKRLRFLGRIDPRLALPGAGRQGPRGARRRGRMSRCRTCKPVATPVLRQPHRHQFPRRVPRTSTRKRSSGD